MLEIRKWKILDQEQRWVIYQRNFGISREGVLKNVTTEWVTAKAGRIEEERGGVGEEGGKGQRGGEEGQVDSQWSRKVEEEG